MQVLQHMEELYRKSYKEYQSFAQEIVIEGEMCLQIWKRYLHMVKHIKRCSSQKGVPEALTTYLFTYRYFKVIETFLNLDKILKVLEMHLI